MRRSRTEDELAPRPRDAFDPVVLDTPAGPVDARHYAVSGATSGMILVGGVGGDWDTPARDLYPRLAERLRDDRLASLRVRYRDPAVLEEDLLDVLAGLRFLGGTGVRRVALAGHSLGGAVVVAAAARAASVRTVVALAPQAYGADMIGTLVPRCSVLLVHGARDRVLPTACSEYLYQLAGKPKRLVIYPDAGHMLDEVAAEVFELVASWTRAVLSEAVER